MYDDMCTYVMYTARVRDFKRNAYRRGKKTCVWKRANKHNRDVNYVYRHTARVSSEQPHCASAGFCYAHGQQSNQPGTHIQQAHTHRRGPAPPSQCKKSTQQACLRRTRPHPPPLLFRMLSTNGTYSWALTFSAHTHCRERVLHDSRSIAHTHSVPSTLFVALERPPHTPARPRGACR